MLRALLVTLIETLLPQTRDSARAKTVHRGDVLQAARQHAIDAHPWVLALGYYRNEALRTIIRACKFGRSKEADDLLQTFVRSALKGHAPPAHSRNERIDLALLIPRNPGQLRRRGFNHLELLQEPLTERFPQMAVSGRILVRSDARPPQAQLAHTSAARTMPPGTLRVSSESAVRGLHVLLVDDVLTSGATLTAAREAVLKAGARDVSGLVLADATGFKDRSAVVQ